MVKYSAIYTAPCEVCPNTDATWSALYGEKLVEAPIADLDGRRRYESVMVTRAAVIHCVGCLMTGQLAPNTQRQLTA